MSTLRNTGDQSSRGRRIARVVPALGIAVLAGVAGLTACADAPSAPATRSATAPRLEIVSPSAPAMGLLRNVPLAAAEEVSATIGRDGGDIKLRESGLQVSFPVGAVQEPTRITVTALPGAIVAYVFQPHGITFAVPVKFEQSFKGTNYDKVAKLAKFEGGYFKDAAHVDPATGTVLVNEFLPADVDSKSGKLKMDLHHFSGYMVAWGRGSK